MKIAEQRAIASAADGRIHRLAVVRDTLTVGVVGHEKRSKQQSHKSSGAVDTGKRTRRGVVPPTQRILVNLHMVGHHKLADTCSEVGIGKCFLEEGLRLGNVPSLETQRIENESPHGRVLHQ